MADSAKDTGGNTQTVTMPEASNVVFTEYRKKIEGTDDYAVYHITVRGEKVDEVLERLNWWDTNLFNMGWTHGDAPKKMQYPQGGRGGGNQRKPKADIPESGKYQVESLVLWEYNNGKQLKIVGVGGEEVVDWGGKHVDAFLKTLTDAAATQPFMGWADWKADEPHPITWAKHKLFVQCVKSDKKDKNGKPYWNIGQFVIE
jgi:hypothetical protein